MHIENTVVGVLQVYVGFHFDYLPTLPWKRGGRLNPGLHMIDPFFQVQGDFPLCFFNKPSNFRKLRTRARDDM